MLWGFDLTEFPDAETFMNVLDEIGLDPVTDFSEVIDPETKERKAFKWENSFFELVTANNPISGHYGRKGRREDEKGYASYMGLTGEPKEVKHAVKVIRKYANFIKDESKNARDFI